VLRNPIEIEKRVEFLLMPLLEMRGMVLVDIEVKGIGNRGLVRIYVDREGGVTIDDCADLSRELSVLLDAEDFIPGPYVLEVSSPGLGRVLKKDRELRWARGKDIIAYAKGGIELRGKLIDFTDETLSISIEGKTVEVRRDEVTKIKLEDRE
jgi:ribosome maturation factor RimP